MSDFKYSIEVDRVARDEWSSLLEVFDDANLYQTWGYAEVVHPKETASRLVLRDERGVVALAQVRIVTLPVVKRGIAYVAWGPLWRKKGEAEEWTRFAGALEALKTEYAGKRKLLLRITPGIPEDSAESPVAALEAASFKLSVGGGRYRTILVDVSRPLDEIRKTLAQKWRNCLNRAERNDLECAVGTSTEDYDVFLAMYRELRRRKDFETNVDAELWRGLHAALPEEEKLRIVLCRSGDEAVAAVVVSGIGEAGVYLLGATSAEGLKLKASYLAQWRAIEWLKSRGCRYYDLGGIDPEGNPGVYRFKSRMGGAEAAYLGVYDYCESALSRVAVAGGEMLRRLKGASRR